MEDPEINPHTYSHLILTIQWKAPFFIPYFYFMYMSAFLALVCVQHLQWSEEGIRSLGTTVTAAGLMPQGFRECNLCHL